MRAFEPVKMRVKRLNESISIEPVFGGNALEWFGPLAGETLDFS
ncbi:MULTISPECIES: hypothetical protein [Gluconacetobacter]|nr:hypothetical protein [Gluconacetobacter dulcium]